MVGEEIIKALTKLIGKIEKVNDTIKTKTNILFIKLQSFFLLKRKISGIKIKPVQNCLK